MAAKWRLTGVCAARQPQGTIPAPGRSGTSVFRYPVNTVQRRYMYISHAVTPFSRDDLAALALLGQRENARRGITGILVYTDGHFLQMIEGPQNDIGQLKTNLQRDRRHDNITELIDEPVERRLFDGWTLATENLFNRSDSSGDFSLEVARRLARVAHSDSDFQVLGMLSRFWQDFSGHVELHAPATAHWSPAAARDAARDAS